MNEEFMKERPVLSLLLSMALPMILSMLVNSLYNIVDSFFVAKINEDAMTALSLVFPIQNFVNAVAIGFGVGINAVIAFYLGAKKPDKANAAASKGTLLSVVHGVIMMVVCIRTMPGFLRMFTSNETVVQMGIQYSMIVFAFSVIISIDLSFEKIYQAVGRMVVTMVGLGGGCLMNIVLDPLLIFGIGPFPKMGIRGAALATGLGQVFTLLIYLFVYVFRPISVKIGRRYLHTEDRLTGKLYAIGIPAILNMALPSLLTTALNAILSTYSQIYVVILGIYYKLQTFLYLPANGMIQGMRPVISYNYGAGEHKRVRSIYNITLTIIGLIMVFGTVICLIFPDKLIGMFSDNQATITEGATALRIICAGFIVSSVSVTSSGALEGLGKGTPSLMISLLRYVVVIIPAAFVLSRIFGVVGVWNAFWVAELITAVAALFIYRQAVKRKS